MIELIIKNMRIALSLDAVTTREVETRIFNKEPTAYDFNIPIDLPLTDETRIALEFPDVIAATTLSREYPAKLIIDAVYSTAVKVILLSVSQVAKTCRITIVGSYASLADVFGDAKVCELVMGGFDVLTRSEVSFEELNFTMPQNIRDGAYEYGEIRIKYRGSDVNAYMTAVAKGIIITDYLFPKALDIKGDTPSNSGGIDIINAYDYDRDRYVEADLYNFVNSEWQWIPDTTPMNQYEAEQRHWWVPMYKLTKVLEHCFTEYGISVDNAILGDAKLRDVVLYNTHAINTGFVGEWKHTYPDNYLQITAGFPNAYLLPRNHLPKMKIIDFLNEIGKRYNWQFQYNVLYKKIEIIADKNTTTTIDNIIDLSDNVNPKAIINFEQSDAFLNGYRFKFDSDGADSATSTDVQDDVYKYSSRGSIAALTDIGTILLPLVEEVVFVRNTNTWHKYDSEEGWILYSHNIGAYNSSGKDNAQEVTTQVVSCPMTIPDIQMIPINIYMGGPEFGVSYTNSWESVPFSEIGITFDQYNYIDWDALSGPEYPIGTGVGHPWISHFNSARKSPIAHLPHVITCVGFRKGILGSEREYYMATTGHYNSRGELLDIYSGSWTNENGMGIYRDWWADFVIAVTNSMVVEYDVLLDAATYHNINVNSTKFKIDGLFFLCKKASFVQPMPSVNKMSLVKIS